MLLAITGLSAVPAEANGNNGTVKVDDQGLDPGAPNSNDPHIECAGVIEWYGFDEDVTSDITFVVQRPTSNTGAANAPTSQSYLDVPVDGDGAGGAELDGRLDFDLSGLLSHYQPHPQQGYHVKVTIETTFSNGGSDIKDKVFWVQPCAGDEFGALTIDKDVTGNDLPAESTAFTFTVDCTYENSAVDLNGDDAGNTATFTLTAAGAAQSFSLLPTGATCSVSETNAQGADSTTMSVNGGAPSAGTTVSGLVIGNATTVTVLATNVFDTTGGGPTFGSLSVNKDVTGNDQPAGTTEFTFTVDCTYENLAVDLNGGAAGTQAVVVLTAGEAPEVLSSIPTGASCSVSETNAQGADSTTMSVNGGAPSAGTTVSGLVIGNATTVTVLATNVFDTTGGGPTFGSLSVNKDVTGNDQPAGTTEFTFTVDCTYENLAVDLNGGAAGTQAVVVLTAGEAPEVLSSIPTGASCSVSETNAQGADSTTMSVNGGAPSAGTTVSGLVIGNATTVTVLATNVFDTTGGGGPTFGSLSVNKDVSGDAPVATTEFSFDVDCSNGVEQSFELTAGDPAHVISGLPTGTSCTVVETDDRDADGTTWTGGTAIPGENGVSVTIGNDTTVGVTATNSFQAVLTEEIVPETPGTPGTPETPGTLGAVETPGEPTTEVKGEVIRRAPAQLPRTGNDLMPMVQMGLGMILLGAGAMLFGRERTASI